jgi:zinc-ribbon domain
MAEILGENQVCENCGAEIRLNAAFCFNCGSQLVPDDMVELVNEGKVSNAWFKESITEHKAEAIKMPTEPLNAPRISDKSGVELTPLAIADNPSATKTEILNKTETLLVDIEEKPIKKEKKPPETVASMRQKPKLPPKQKVEVTWEKPTNTSNVWFLLVALILLSLAVGLVVTMLYIR